jgi:hypothetical protein
MTFSGTDGLVIMARKYIRAKEMARRIRRTLFLLLPESSLRAEFGLV